MRSNLDRTSLARALAAEIVRQGRAPLLFVQVNTGEEPQKGGVAPAALGASSPNAGRSG